MSSVVIDETLEFHFPNEWVHNVYEKSEIRKSLHNKIQTIRCVDLLLLDTIGKVFYIIEVKDFNTTAKDPDKEIEISGPMSMKLAEKHVDTLAGLTCAKLCGNEELKQFYRAMWNPRYRKRLVSFIELGDLRERRIRTGISMIANLTQKMKILLKPVGCKKFFCDRERLPADFGWTVNRIANFREN